MDNSSEIPDTSKAINDRLQFLWAQYMNMISLFITLSTGSLALSTGLIKFQTQMSYNGKGWLIAALSSLVLSLIASTVWRIITQIFMEQEVFGNTEFVNSYYQKEKVIPFTSSHLYTASYPFHNVCQIGVIICMFLTAIGLPLGLMLISVFVVINI